MRNSLKWGVLAAIPVVLLSLAPQGRLWLARGSQWQGAYAIVDGDEYLYSAYINALIDGRPRRNDPFSGRDDHPNTPLPESAFSIQFLPPLVISSVAKLFGLTASTAFILLIGFSALSGAITIFWLLKLLMEDDRLAALGTVFVLLLGTVAAGEGVLAAFFSQNVSRLGLPFLRRYQPAAPFFLFFAFVGLVYSGLTSGRSYRRRLLAALSGVILGGLIFSYLYLWTAGAAWLVTIASLYLYLRSDHRRQTIEMIGLITVLSLMALGPYMYLISNRAPNLDQTQTLISTHRPDPFRVPEVLGMLVIVLIFVAVRRKTIQLRDPSIIFALSFAILPFLVFNQQVVTGRSMQPFHFEHFILNYAALISIAILAINVLRSVSSRFVAAVACGIVLVGAVEVIVPTEIRIADDKNNDQIVPVLLRLKALSATDGTFSNLRREGKTSMLVFSPDISVLLLLPSWTAQGTMVGLGGLDFGSASPEDRKVFAYLYFSGVDTRQLGELLHSQGTDLALTDYARSALFGHERVFPELSFTPRPVQEYEIQEQLRAYDAYVKAFSPSEVLKHRFAYVVVNAGNQFDFSRIDRWYERSPPERIGDFELYRVAQRESLVNARGT